MARPDVTVLGAGIFGLSVAWEMAMRGARVRVIDPGGVGAGASGGLVGALAPHVPEAWNAKKAFQLESLLMAEGWWQKVAAAGGGDPGYGRLGRLQPLPDARAVDAARVRGVEAALLWQGRAAWQVVRATGAAWEPATATALMIRDDLSARVQPRQALAALVAAIRTAGGDVVREGDTVGAVVHATGVAGLLALDAAQAAAAGGARVPAMGAGRGMAFGAAVATETGPGQGGGRRFAVKGQALTLRFQGEGLPQLFVDGLHIVPHADGTVAVGSTSENQWDDPVSTDGQLEALHARAVAALPVLAGAPVVERWAALRPRASSRAPVLGAWPGRAGHYVANGGFKIGFGMAPLVAEVVADLVLDGPDRIPAGFRVG